MRPFTTSTTTRPGASGMTRSARTRRHGALATVTACALTLAACGGSARSSMRPVIVEGGDRTSGAVETPTTRRTSVTAKIDTASTVAPPRQSRTDNGGAGSASAGDGSGAGVGDLEAPPTSAEPAAGGGGGTDGGTGGGGSGLDGSDAVTTTASTEAPTTTTPPSTTTSLPPGAVAINVRQTTQYGPILVDGENHTLYASIADVNNEGTCHGACTAQWIPIAGNTVAPGDGISTSLIGAITRADTIVQLTYGGHPLYRLNNEPIGEAMGQGDAATWYVVSAQTGALVVT
ncbi:MAG: hypothetical protein AB7O92_02165 [Acidimicrobiia bacterium]